MIKWLKLQWHYLKLGVTEIPDTYRWNERRVSLIRNFQRGSRSGFALKQNNERH
jgi:hypothetical protein